MRHLFLVCVLEVLALTCFGLFPSGAAAQTEEYDPDAVPAGETAPDIDLEKTPWLEGVDIPTQPDHPSPVLKAEILMADGSPVPATLTEDVAVLMAVDSEIFAEKAPQEWEGQTLSNAVWIGNPVVNWYLDDLSKAQSTLANVNVQLPNNQMLVTPLDPLRDGGVTVAIARQMAYEETPRRERRVFANSSRALFVQVTDITPPTSGLQIQAGGKEGSFWAVENPPHGYPLPKRADVFLKGPLVSPTGQDEQIVVSGLELGSAMILSPEQGAVRLPKTGEVKINLLLQDNDQVDEKTVRSGLGEIVNGVPVPVEGTTGASFDLGKINLPAEPYLFIDVTDLSGNRQVLCVPVVIE